MAYSTKNKPKSQEFYGYKLYLKYFPRLIFGSQHKNQFYHTKERLHALKEFIWVQYNSDERFRVLSIDIDNSTDTMIWEDYSLPRPTWIIQTDKGFQYHWALKEDIPLRVATKKTLKLIKDIQLKLCSLLNGDKYALGLNRVYRNPNTNRTWFSGLEYALSDFYDLPTPPKEWLDGLLGRIQKQKDLFGNIVPNKKYDFGSMSSGDGRNVALFDTLRYWAYDESKSGTYSEQRLLQRAFILNCSFNEPLEEKEMNMIVSSIDGFIETKFNKGYYMALSKEERSKIASENGAKGGKKRKEIAKAKILANLNRLDTYELKITVSGLARDSETNPKTVRAYLKELGYKEISRTEGWKRKLSKN